MGAGLAAAESVLTDQQARKTPEQSTASSGNSPSPTVSASNSLGDSGGGSCLIPGWPGDVDAFKASVDLSFSTCPAEPKQYGTSTDFQVRSQVINAALHQCMLADATPEQEAGYREVIRKSCDYAAAFRNSGSGCTCPPELLRDSR